MWSVIYFVIVRGCMFVFVGFLLFFQLLGQSLCLSRAIETGFMELQRHCCPFFCSSHKQMKLQERFHFLQLLHNQAATLVQLISFIGVISAGEKQCLPRATTTGSVKEPVCFLTPQDPSRSHIIINISSG
ncbi:hypothetical protein AMECASPLE_007644 [Ameca splendens]|uniref:Secreted protein n=1 Tax=Ameca splendens TaxID=208324 RepID=A0ABV0XZR5_9TELE